MLNVEQVTSETRRFDVFLSHNSRDKADVERIATRLARARVKVWFDKWSVTPGRRWHEELAEGLRASSACAVFIGPSDMGDWVREEVAVALDRSAKERSFRVFLVLLPGLTDPFDPTALSPFLSSRTWVDFRRGLDDTRANQALINAIKGIPIGPDAPLHLANDVSPYRGLAAFAEEDADWFFGRDADTQRLLEKLKESAFVAVIGPSGSGKSSLARAGLVPALRRGALPRSDRWIMVTLRPGAHPLDALAGHLSSLYPDLAVARIRDQLADDGRTLRLLCSRAPPGGERVLFLVDQLEEVFTVCRQESARHAFLLNLLHAATAGGAAVVIPTLRADFYPHCAAYPELAQQIASHQFLVGPMNEGGLRQVITEPARLAGLELESGLVDTIIEDVQHQPGALPLLEHALLELWERRRGRMLTLEAYQESGGVAGALAKRADDILESFRPDERAVLRRVLLRLTHPGEGVEDTRRQAPISELVTSGRDRDAVEAVIAALAEARLVTTSGHDQPFERQVEVSHEALIRGWPQLRRWVDEDRQGLRAQRRLTEAAREWQALDRDPGALYRGVRLAEAREWADEHGTELNELEQEFLRQSYASQLGELDAARARARRFRGLAAGLALFAVLAGTLATFAVRSANSARRARDRAQDQEQIATSRRLAAEADQIVATRPDTALLLSLEAYRRKPTYEARDSLVAAFERDARTSMILYSKRTDGTSVAFTPDGSTLVLADRSGRIWRWNRDGQVLNAPLAAFAGGSNEVVVSANGQAAAFALGTRVGVWSSARPRSPAVRLNHRGFDASSLSFSADASRLAVADSDGRIELWNVARRRLQHRRVRLPGGAPESIALSPDGSLLAESDQHDLIRLWDTDRWGLRQTLSAGFGDDVEFSPDGKTLAAFPRGAVGEISVALWSVRRRRSLGVLDTQMVTLGDVAFSPDGKTIAIADESGAIELWDTRTRHRIGSRLTGPRGLVDSLAFSPDGHRLASGSWNGTVRIWRTAPHEPLATPLGRRGQAVGAIAFAGATTVVSADTRGTLRTWDTGIRSLVGESTAARMSRPGRVFLSSGARTLAVLGPRALRVFDARRQQRVARLPTSKTAAFEENVALSADGKRIATLTDTGRLQLWDAMTGSPLGAPLQRRIPGEAIAFSPDGRVLAFMQDGVVFLYATDTRRWSRRPFRHPPDEQILSSSGTGALALSSDGRTLASSGPDGTIRLWDVASRTLLADPLPGHPSGVTSLTFNPRGTVLASTGLDGKIRLFDVTERRALGDPLRSGADGGNVTFNPSGESLGSAGSGGHVLLWDPILWSRGLPAWQKTVCGLVRRGLTRAERKEFAIGESEPSTCPARTR